jgi:hypothetical protein
VCCSLHKGPHPYSSSRILLSLTFSRFFITASTADCHRVLKIDRTDPTNLNVVEDATTYDSAELDLLLRMVQDGNKSQGGLEKVLEFQYVPVARDLPRRS